MTARVAFYSLLLALSLVLPVAAEHPYLVREEPEALRLFNKARAALAGLGLVIPREIPLKFRTRDEVTVESNSSGGRAIEIDGFYRPYNPEEIWIVRDLAYDRTLGAMSHELTHAWQSTESPMQDRKLKEGFACWTAYHVLMSEGCTHLAQVLRNAPDPDYGGGLRALLDIEERQGAAGVIVVARTKAAL